MQLSKVSNIVGLLDVSLNSLRVMSSFGPRKLSAFVKHLEPVLDDLDGNVTLRDHLANGEVLNRTVEYLIQHPFPLEGPDSNSGGSEMRAAIKCSYCGQLTEVIIPKEDQ